MASKEKKSLFIVRRQKVLEMHPEVFYKLQDANYGEVCFQS
jgi:hypothetical protein